MATISLDPARASAVTAKQDKGSFSAQRATNCGACPDLCWFVVLPEWQQEPLARQSVVKLGAQVFAPQVRVMIPQRNRPAIRQLQPAFPGYLFVLCEPGRIASLRYARGVAGLLYEVGQAAAPAIVPTGLMSTMIKRASIQGVLERTLATKDEPLPAWVVGPDDPAQARVKRQWRALHDLAEMASDDRLKLLHEIVGTSDAPR